ncbi:unnamed protein product [Bathycoccus prasinos]
MKSFALPAAARRQPSFYSSSRTSFTSRRGSAMVPARRSTRRRLGERAGRKSSGLNNPDGAIVDVRVERLVLDADDAKEEEAFEVVRVERLVLDADDAKEEEAFEVVRATATRKTTKTEDECDDDGILCLCVPGNPGGQQQNENKVRRRSVTVECVGFLGHYADGSLTSAKTRRWFTLEEQKAHVLKYVRSRVEEENACFLVGHSIGAHVAMHAVKEMREEDVKKMVGLMPFLHVNERSNVQKFLAWLVSQRVVVRVVAKVLGFMQKFKALKKTIERSATRGMKCELGISVTKRWAREMSLVNMALMGDTEFKFLRDWKRNVVDVLKAHAKKICFVYAKEDHWGPLHQRDELMEEIGLEELEIVTDESYEHAFVLDDESSKKLAEQCARMLLN